MIITKKKFASSALIILIFLSSSNNTFSFLLPFSSRCCLNEHRVPSGLSTSLFLSTKKKPKDNIVFNAGSSPKRFTCISLSAGGTHTDISCEDRKRKNIIRDAFKTQLQTYLLQVPANAPTPKDLTDKILASVRDLESCCPTPEEEVLDELGGNWELIWTAQDRSSPEGQQSPLVNFINPIENQSYSINPNGVLSSNNDQSIQKSNTGRANPILPRGIQDKLEELGILESSVLSTNDSKITRSTNDTPVQSSQAINLKRMIVRNVVSFQIAARFLAPLPFFQRLKEKGGDSMRGSLTVDVAFKPNQSDRRKINVQFQSCRLSLKNSPIDITFPLGVIGPSGWLWTGYIDDDMRITRGHKGSVFILSRTSQKNKRE